MRTICKILCAFLVVVNFSIGLGQKQDSSSELRWPKPPERARVKFLYSVSGKRDVVGEKSWFRKAIEFIFGEEKETGYLLRPQAIAVGNDGRMYVTDTQAKGIHVFAVEKKEYKFIAPDGDKTFISPVGIAIAEDGLLYVADADRHEVIVLGQDGDYKFSINVGLLRPTGVWISDGVLYVVDTQGNQIVAYDLQGHEKYRFGKRGVANQEFNFPVYVCAGNLSQREWSNNLYVVDALNFRVQTLRKDGLFVSTFGKLGDGVGDFARPKGIALDSDGHIYVADALFDVVQVFAGNGELLLSFGGSGSSPGNFSLPTGLTIDANDHLYVVDSGNRRVQVFQYLK